MSAVSKMKEKPRKRAPSAEGAPPARDWTLAVCLALIVLTILIYAPVRNFGFVNFDDPDYTLANPQVSAGLSIAGIQWALTTGHMANWHPVTWISHMLDIQMFGMHAGPHHLVNVLFHIVNSLLLFALLRRMTGALWRSAVVAALFAVHPAHVESVAWISERKDVLSTLLGLLVVWFYVDYVRNSKLSTYAAVFLLLALGLMAKPMLVTLPMVLLLLDFWPLNRLASPADLPGLIREKMPMFGLVVASAVVTFIAQSRGAAVVQLVAVPINRRIANACMAYLGYIRNTFWPTGLAAYYPYPESPGPWWVGAGVAFLAISLLAVWAAVRYPYLFVGWFWFAGTLVPVIGLIQVGNQSMADRYTYIPYIGLFIMIAWGAGELAKRFSLPHVVVAASVGLAVLSCSVVARGQVAYWQDSEHLWGRALAVTSGNSFAHNNLGSFLLDQGRFDEAIFQFSEGVRINPGNAMPHYNLGNALDRRGRLDEASIQYMEALRLSPAFADAHSNLGVVLARQGKLAEAVTHLSEAVRLNPGSASAHTNLGAILAGLGKIAEARAEFTEALRLNPGDPKAKMGMQSIVGH